MKSEEKKEYDRIYSRRYRKEHPEAKAIENKKNSHKINEAVKLYFKKNPNVRRAYIIFTEAVRTGKIVRGRCVFSGQHNGKIDGHHNDYSKPLDVVWMCHSHHKKFHYGLVKVASKY